MTVQECYANDDLGTRLWGEAADYWADREELDDLRNDPVAYRKYLDQHPADGLQFVVYLVVDIFTNFCKAMKEAGIAKKVFGEIAVLTGSNAMKTAKTWLGYSEVFSKADNLTKPLRERTVEVYQNDKGTELNTDGTLANGVQAGPASQWEAAAKKASQVADWVMPVMDVGEYLAGQVVLLSGIRSVAGVVLSTQGLYEEVTRLSTGNIVRADKTNADGFVWKMRQEDEVHSWMKVVMNVAYLAMGVFGLAGLAVNIPGAVFLGCYFVGNSANLLSHFWEKICIDPLGRAQQQAIS
jgi:hypothetical protein